jgi:hypothetical protein
MQDARAAQHGGARCFFFDLDVGEGDHKYASQTAALAGLIQFCKTHRYHVPWSLRLVVGFTSTGRSATRWSSDEWRDHATRFAAGTALRPQGSILRARLTRRASCGWSVASTGRTASNPRPVRAQVCPAKPTATGVLRQAGRRCADQGRCRAEAGPKLVQAEGLLGSNLDTEYDGPVPSMGAVSWRARR